MFQKILPLHPLYHQGKNGVDQRRGEDAFGREILMGIDKKGEEGDVQHQAGHRHGRDLALVGANDEEELPDRIVGIELDEIIDDQAQDGSYQAQYEAETEIVFFEDHDFHVFSSLLLRT